MAVGAGAARAVIYAVRSGFDCIMQLLLLLLSLITVRCARQYSVWCACVCFGPHVTRRTTAYTAREQHPVMILPSMALWALVWVWSRAHTKHKRNARARSRVHKYKLWLCIYVCFARAYALRTYYIYTHVRFWHIYRRRRRRRRWRRRLPTLTPPSRTREGGAAVHRA